MAELANTYLRQARGFVRAGDSSRAVELLERARVLAKGEPAVMRAVLEELSGAYSAVGQHEKAAKCSEKLAAMEAARPQPAVAQSSPFGETSSNDWHASPTGWPAGQAAGIHAPAGAFASAARGRPKNRKGLWIGIIAANVLLFVGLDFYLFRAEGPLGYVFNGPRVVVHAENHVSPAISTNPATKAGANTIAAVLNTAASPPAGTPPVPTNPVAGQISPSTTTRPAATPPGDPSRPLSISKLLGESVGMLFVMARFEDVVNGKSIRFDLPLGHGTAFAVAGREEGYMLTNRHVVEVKQDEIPDSLKIDANVSLPRRKIFYLACFGPETADRYEADVVHISGSFDMALIKVRGRRFDHPLKLAPTEPELRDPVWVCGYPGIVTDVLSKTSADKTRQDEFKRQAFETGNYDFILKNFSADCFRSTLTNGIVSAEERTINNASYFQTNAVIHGGNSGGPVLDGKDRVIGIATLGAVKSEQYNFVLRLGQLRSELAPYLKGE